MFIEPEHDGTFAEQLEQVERAYDDALRATGLSRASAVFRRCFLSDAANQLDIVMRSSLGVAGENAESVAVSCIEQPPLSQRKLALMAYHIGDVGLDDKRVVSMPDAGPNAHTLVLARGDREFLWSAQMSGGASTVEPKRSADQTRRVLSSYSAMLRSRDATLLANAVRTWVFVQGVDTNYDGMVDARRELFRREGLTEQTHYLVSTGIEGRTAHHDDLVTVDALAIGGLDPEQMEYIDCLDHLNRTEDYGVTFERAVRLKHADRNHVYLAGTASIDAQGRVLHEGDIRGQVTRTMENVSALLAQADASTDDIAAMILYLRDAADAERVREMITRIDPALPLVAVRAPVCRPTWLVEVEVLAITQSSEPCWPAF